MSERTAARQWYDRAGGDLRDARHLLQESEGTVENVAFLAQQAIEKYLKAILVSRRERPPRTHDLDRLVSLVLDLGVDLSEELISRAEELSSYAVAVRYPGAEIRVDQSDAEMAVQLAGEIRQVTRRAISD